MTLADLIKYAEKEGCAGPNVRGILWPNIILKTISNSFISGETMVSLNINTVFEQIARNHLNRSLDRLIESVKKDFG